MMNDNNSEVKLWLKTVLKDENIEDYSVTVEGTSEKGDGYSGDIIFVTLIPLRKDNRLKNYDLALKCSKPNDAFVQNIRIDEVYLNEAYIYGRVFPEFARFQVEKGISGHLNSVAKCFGTLSVGNREVIVLENLKKLGYTLWNKKKPLTRRHIDMVLTEYAKFHALSIAMNDQQPQKFNELRNGVADVFQKFFEASGLETNFVSGVEEVYDVLQGELDETILQKWRELKKKISYVFHDMLQGIDGPKVINHGDSWCNNFLFKHDGDENVPSKMIILDWQMSRYTTPITDLSYFIFASISKEDIENMDAILQHYHNSLGSFLERLGSNVDLLYPYNQFLSDWKKYCKYGIVACCMVLKVCSSDKDEVVDLAEKGEDFTKMFSYDVRDKSCFKGRTKHIVKYAVENDLI